MTTNTSHNSKTTFLSNIMNGRKMPDMIHLWILLFVGLMLGAGLTPESFLSGNNFNSMASQMPELAILTFAMMITLMSGGINLATIAIANFAALTMAYTLQFNFVISLFAVSPVLGAVFVIFLGLSTGLLLGAITGAIIAYLGVSPILATLGAMTLIDGANLMLSGGSVISNFPEIFSQIGQGVVLSIPIPLVIFAILTFFIVILFDKTKFGIKLRFIGSNVIASEYSGVDVRKTIVQVYAISGILAALAGLIMMSRFNSVNVSYGQSYLLVTILAAVLGGVDPFGGRGSVMKVVLALIILQLVSSVMNLLALSNHITLIIWGGLLLFGLIFLRNASNR